jgi:hypothetical protein
MADAKRRRPATTEDEIERTGRDQQVVPGADLAAPGTAKDTSLDEHDAPEGGVDSADFPGAGAP